MKTDGKCLICVGPARSQRDSVRSKRAAAAFLLSAVENPHVSPGGHYKKVKGLRKKKKIVTQRPFSIVQKKEKKENVV